MPRWAKIVAAVIGLVVVLVIGAGLWIRERLQGSLPILDGEVAVAGMSERVVVERDALGVPTIRGSSRPDVAFALGFLHAQERFFQMDLLRRSGAGELAELFGEAAVDADRAARIHRFRALARRNVELLPGRHRAVLRAYTDGVNAGLSALGAAPFEYLLLRSDPEPWIEEDSLLVLFAMFFELNDSTGSRESARGLLAELIDPELASFLDPPGTSWDAALDGVVFEPPPFPSPPVATRAPFDGHAPVGEPARAAVGSNNWAVAGARTADGRAILADDMHLGLALPNTWYRAALKWPEAGGRTHRLIGVTLPGTPTLIAGSNTLVAWGFTNSYGDWSDLVVLEPTDDGYLTPDGPRSFEVFREVIEVHGADAVVIDVPWTIWGPVVDDDHRGRKRALRWTAHSPEAADLGLLDVEVAATLEEAQAAANRTGIPPQNFVCADAGGHIGWTIIGAIPTREGFDGRVPTSWADGSRRWNGWLPPDEYPRIVDPAAGVLWTANNRQVSGAALAVIGDGGFDLGARARQIRDDLLAIDSATEADMLQIQLDDRAVFLERWRDLALAVLTDDAVAGHLERARFRELVETTWTGRASIDSQAYRLVRALRFEVFELVYGALLTPLADADERFDIYRFVQWEDSLWRLLKGGPSHLLPPDAASWNAVVLTAIDRTMEYFTTDVDPDPAAWTWGARNTVRIQHPISRAVPQLAGWLDIEPRPLPGDSNMPRVQSPRFGASERFAVSPGRESDGFFHMPGGQSGHPLSPHYRAGHDDWADGRPTPFLPGETVSTLTLTPVMNPEDPYEIGDRRLTTNNRRFRTDAPRACGGTAAQRAGT